MANFASTEGYKVDWSSEAKQESEESVSQDIQKISEDADSAVWISQGSLESMSAVLLEDSEKSNEELKVKHDPLCLCTDCLNPLKQIAEKNVENIRLMKQQYSIRTSTVPPWLQNAVVQSYNGNQTNEVEQNNRIIISSSVDGISVEESHKNEENSNGLDISSTSDTVEVKKTHITKEQQADGLIISSSIDGYQLSVSLAESHYNFLNNKFSKLDNDILVESMSESECNAVTSSYSTEYTESVNGICQCPYCNFTSNQPTTMHNHLLSEHVARKSEDNGYEKLIICSHCDYTCTSVDILKMHVLTRHPEDNFVFCPHCEYRGVDSDNLRIHVMAEHTNVKIFACPHCPYSAFQSEYVTKHIVYNHFNNKEFCSSSFAKRPWKMSNS